MASSSICSVARSSPRRRSTRRWAAISPKAMTMRSTIFPPPAGGGGGALRSLEARSRQQTGIATLKIRHNGVLGYHIEVPARHADPLIRAESGFTHRQTLAGVVRFNAPDLHEQAVRVGQAGAHALAAEAAHLEILVEA